MRGVSCVGFGKFTVPNVIMMWFTVSFVAVGVRLYFTTTHDGQRGRPVLLAMVHARLPPGYSPSSAIFKPGNTIHLAHYRKGVYIKNVVLCSVCM